MSTLQIKLPDSMLAQVRELAEKEHMSLDDFVVLAVAERVSALRGIAYFRDRARRGSAEKLKELLAKVPDVEPEPGDRIEP